MNLRDESGQTVTEYLMISGIMTTITLLVLEQYFKLKTLIQQGAIDAAIERKR
jgi:hypothetical protein